MRIATKNSLCRICNSRDREEILNFGDMALTGVFAQIGADVPEAPLCLIRCLACGLVQLAHTYESSSLYGETYGYESHLNNGMALHLKRRAKILESKYLSQLPKPIIVDIASNDGTLLSGYENQDSQLIGIDPLISVVSDYYPAGAVKIPHFFSASAYSERNLGKANLVTSMAVLYDLESPATFASDIYEILDEGGIWHFEQSYLPTMIKTLSYDTICHEHLLYLSLHDIQRIAQESGFQLLDASLNSANGGSISVTAIKSNSQIKSSPFVEFLLQKEISEGLEDGSMIRDFATQAKEHKVQLTELIQNYREAGFLINGLGASTKGNVLLQWLGLDSTVISSIGDVNSRKYGKQTPGTGIPIVPEEIILQEANAKSLTLVLPWHFREGIIGKSTSLLEHGGSLLFPLPQIEVIA
jgi:hypothetical protein